MKTLIRYWMRRRFAKALDKADWRNATLGPDASYEVQRLRTQTFLVNTNKESVIDHETTT